MPNIKVMHFGLGPIGAAIVRQVATRPGFKIVGAVDIDPAKREAAYVDIQRIFLKDAPLVFIANLGATGAWRSNVSGFLIDGLSYYRFEDVTLNR